MPAGMHMLALLARAGLHHAGPISKASCPLQHMPAVVHTLGWLSTHARRLVRAQLAY